MPVTLLFRFVAVAGREATVPVRLSRVGRVGQPLQGGKFLHLVRCEIFAGGQASTRARGWGGVSSAPTIRRPTRCVRSIPSSHLDPCQCSTWSIRTTRNVMRTGRNILTCYNSMHVVRLQRMHCIGTGEGIRHRAAMLYMMHSSNSPGFVKRELHGGLHCLQPYNATTAHLAPCTGL